MGKESLDDEWVRWSDEPEQVVLVYRPDVFDGGDFPSPCLPTIYVTRGRRSRRPGGRRVGTEWTVTLTLEPDVTAVEATAEDRDGALERAVDVAERFASGAVDYRDAYQVPRPAYLDRLDELTGREPADGDASTDEGA